jgi:hypothetical protein
LAIIAWGKAMSINDFVDTLEGEFQREVQHR